MSDLIQGTDWSPEIHAQAVARTHREECEPVEVRLLIGETTEDPAAVDITTKLHPHQIEFMKLSGPGPHRIAILGGSAAMIGLAERIKAFRGLGKTVVAVEGPRDPRTSDVPPAINLPADQSPPVKRQRADPTPLKGYQPPRWLTRPRRAR